MYYSQAPVDSQTGVSLRSITLSLSTNGDESFCRSKDVRSEAPKALPLCIFSGAEKGGSGLDAASHNKVTHNFTSFSRTIIHSTATHISVVGEFSSDMAYGEHEKCSSFSVYTR